jgi:hypothetical protein
MNSELQRGKQIEASILMWASCVIHRQRISSHCARSSSAPAPPASPPPRPAPRAPLLASWACARRSRNGRRGRSSATTHRAHTGELGMLRPSTSLCFGGQDPGATPRPVSSSRSVHPPCSHPRPLRARTAGHDERHGSPRAALVGVVPVEHIHKPFHDGGQGNPAPRVITQTRAPVAVGTTGQGGGTLGVGGGHGGRWSRSSGASAGRHADSAALTASIVDAAKMPAEAGSSSRKRVHQRRSQPHMDRWPEGRERARHCSETPLIRCRR